MARQISDTNTRLVFNGSAVAPVNGWAEYRVDNGTLAEESKHKDFDPLPDVNTNSNVYWTARIDELKADEGIV